MSFRPREVRMSQLAKNVRQIFKLSGFKFGTLSRNVRSLPFYLRDYSRLKQQSKTSREPLPFGNMYPILEDRHAQAGNAGGHYFHQDLHVARKVFGNNPLRHIDIGSRVDGFVAHVASFRAIDVIDVRPLTSSTPNIQFLQADLMSELPADLVACTDSLSCLHAIEHFGLGRYGDPIHFEGHLVGLANMSRMLKPGGKFYLSTPISEKQRIEFNAHRVFSIPYLLDKLQQHFHVDQFAYVGDDGQLHDEIDLTQPEAQASFHLDYGCGIFELTRTDETPTTFASTVNHP